MVTRSHNAGRRHPVRDGAHQAGARQVGAPVESHATYAGTRTSTATSRRSRATTAGRSRNRVRTSAATARAGHLMMYAVVATAGMTVAMKVTRSVPTYITFWADYDTTLDVGSKSFALISHFKNWFLWVICKCYPSDISIYWWRTDYKKIHLLQNDWTIPLPRDERTELELFGTGNTGINFSKYEDIPVEASGDRVPDFITSVCSVKSTKFIE